MADQGKSPFHVGERYENRKGLFSVLSIDGDHLAIRWDTGEEAITSVELQAKVLRNMERELLAGSTKKGYQAPRSYGELFRGLRAEDFTGDVTGTHWRAREQLGGAVTKTLTASEPFDSWSIYRRAEVHWASIARRRLVSTLLQTKFFVRITSEALLHGLYFERSDDRNENQDDWRRFLVWAENPDNCQWLHRTVLRTGAAFTNPYPEQRGQCFYGDLVALENGSFRYEADPPSVFEASALPTFLRNFRDDLWLNLIISRTISRDEAIAQRAGIGSTIGEFFNTFLPVYENRRPVEI